MYINTNTKEYPLSARDISNQTGYMLPARPIKAFLDQFGYAEVISTDMPPGDVVTEGTPGRGGDGLWYQCWNVRDYTPEEIESMQPEAEALYTFKTDVWSRCTDEEADLFDNALSNATAKERRLWQDCMRLEHDSEYFDHLRQTMIELLSDEARVDEILAPSVES